MDPRRVFYHIDHIFGSTEQKLDISESTLTRCWRETHEICYYSLTQFRRTQGVNSDSPHICARSHQKDARDVGNIGIVETFDSGN